MPSLRTTSVWPHWAKANEQPDTHWKTENTGSGPSPPAICGPSPALVRFQTSQANHRPRKRTTAHSVRALGVSGVQGSASSVVHQRSVSTALSGFVTGFMGGGVAVKVLRDTLGAITSFELGCCPRSRADMNPRSAPCDFRNSSDAVASPLGRLCGSIGQQRYHPRQHRSSSGSTLDCPRQRVLVVLAQCLLPFKLCFTVHMQCMHISETPHTPPLSHAQP